MGSSACHTAVASALFLGKPAADILGDAYRSRYTVAGTWASSESEKYWGKDPVIACADETVGQWISLLPLSGIAVTPWWEILLSLVLFRFFDIYKPFGIRSMERFPGGYGMMADDILAGIYSVVILLIVNYFCL